MRKTFVTSVSLITIFLYFASAKPLDNSETPKNHGVTVKPAARIDEHYTDSTGSNYADFTETYSPDEDISAGLISDEANHLTTNLGSVLNEIEHRVTTLKPDSVKPAILRSGLKPDNKKLDSLLTTLEPGSRTAGSLITTLQPVHRGNAGSSATSSESGSGEADSLSTTLESGIVPTTLNIGYEGPGSLTTTLLADSGRRDNSATTPEPVHPSIPLSVKNGHRNGASSSRSSFTAVLLGIFLVARLRKE